MRDITYSFNHGQVISLPQQIDSAGLPWTPHAKFPGVFLKHLVTSAQTQGRFSVHLVRVAAGCTIGEHIHATQYELHAVLEGSGHCHLADKDFPYQPGVCNVIPEGLEHRVTAADGDLFLLAQFVPALL